MVGEPPHPVETLTDRERRYLRLVSCHDNSAEIARAATQAAIDDGAPNSLVTPNMVDKQLKRAMAKLGVDSRHKAARLLAAHEGGHPSAPLPPAPAPRRFSGIPLPVPTRRRPTNDLTVIQRLLVILMLAAAVASGSVVVSALIRTFYRTLGH